MSFSPVIVVARRNPYQKERVIFSKMLEAFETTPEGFIYFRALDGKKKNHKRSRTME